MNDITINDFSGPLDLLLHLIKKNDISIYDIDINDITIKYLNFIRSQKKLNLNISSEYLVMASELLEIKSRNLLPKEDIDESDEEDIDIKENLINRLVEYEQYKEIVNELKSIKTYRDELYTKEAENLNKYDDNIDKKISCDLELLINAYKKLLDSNELKKKINTKITSKEYSINLRNKEIRKIIKEKKEVNFKDLFEIYNKDYVVITFLSILALAKKQEVTLNQEANFKNIIIKEKTNESSY